MGVMVLSTIVDAILEGINNGLVTLVLASKGEFDELGSLVVGEEMMHMSDKPLEGVLGGRQRGHRK
jgi:hypothetical protein